MVTSSSSSSTGASASATGATETTVSGVKMPSSLAFFVPIFQSFVTLKLDSTNYLLWKTQLKNALRANGLFFGYVDGSVASPPEKIINSSGEEVVNVKNTLWKLTDSKLLSYITATISVSTLPRARIGSFLSDEDLVLVFLTLCRQLLEQSLSLLIILFILLNAEEMDIQIDQSQQNDTTSVFVAKSCEQQPDLRVVRAQGMVTTIMWDVKFVSEPITLPEIAIICSIFSISHLLVPPDLNIDLFCHSVSPQGISTPPQANMAQVFSTTPYPSIAMPGPLYFDSGATKHVTNNLSNLSLQNPYHLLIVSWLAMALLFQLLALFAADNNCKLTFDAHCQDQLASGS
ncbi:hypothetical protein Acr_00g0093420 [Actinidia rufa]|uniref:Retrotransposon Copia-like N-terminal domain-containing protein n=1 Tax=Actinidia rufa TaxID=165716 RepID=A0A7J0E073_9ERIC|nr:hypothetical protein Acr_00g0093420 [Actinidia rufa]